MKNFLSLLFLLIAVQGQAAPQDWSTPDHETCTVFGSGMNPGFLIADGIESAVDLTTTSQRAEMHRFEWLNLQNPCCAFVLHTDVIVNEEMEPLCVAVPIQIQLPENLELGARNQLLDSPALILSVLQLDRATFDQILLGEKQTYTLGQILDHFAQPIDPTSPASHHYSGILISNAFGIPHGSKVSVYLDSDRIADLQARGVRISFGDQVRLLQGMDL